jgi:predicted RNA-binding Zn ribbon-like protein
VQALVNTIDIESGHDALATPDDVRRWLAGRGLLAGSTVVTAAESASVVELREALRTLLLANNGDEADDTPARRVLDRVAAAGGVRLRFEPAAVRLEATADGLAGAMAQVVVKAAAAMADGSWSRLKACRDDTCRWAFFDQSKNHSGSWCDMRVCGSRNKMRTYRSRRRTGTD